MLDRGVTKCTTSPTAVSPHYVIHLTPCKQHILKSPVTVFHYNESVC